MIRHTLADNLAEDFHNADSTPVPTLANIWAKKYIQNLQADSTKQNIQSNNLEESMKHLGILTTMKLR